MNKLFLPLFILLGTAQAHTQITGVQPGAFASVTAPQAVRLTLNEAVDLHFATVKVYPLASDKTDQLSLNRAAATLLKTALKSKNDAAIRVNLDPPAAGQVSEVEVKLKPSLKAGPYAILWKLLSNDGHVVSGYSVFRVK